MLEEIAKGYAEWGFSTIVGVIAIAMVVEYRYKNKYWWRKL